MAARWATSVLTMVLILGASACGSNTDPGDTNVEVPAPGADPSPSTASPAPPDSSLAVASPAPSLRLEPAFLADAPTDLAARPGDGRLYVAQRAGTVAVFEPGQRDATKILVDFSDEVGATYDQAFMSLTFDTSGQHLYVHFSRSADGASVLRRYGLDGDQVTSTEDMIVVEQPHPDHNGGSIRFGPDGYLYWALGDGGREVDATTTAQDTTNLLGSLVRIDVSGEDGYAIPSDNPFRESTGRPEIWSYGLRNPWRISFDSSLGDLWIADVGLLDAEEINLAEASDGLGRGNNYGWPEREGSSGVATPGVESVDPIWEYNHDGGRCSITGGEVYRGTAIPDLDGEYLFGDFCSGEIMSVRPGSSPRLTVYEPVLPQVVGFASDTDGELYALAVTGEIVRLVAG